MTCPDPERLAAYIDDTLSVVARHLVETHLVDCDDCRELVFLASTVRDQRPIGGTTHHEPGAERSALKEFIDRVQAIAAARLVPKKFKLLGYDTFEGGDAWYTLGEFSTEGDARKAAKVRLAELEQSQPTATSGGQALLGIQDHVFIEFPDGHRERVRYA